MNMEHPELNDRFEIIHEIICRKDAAVRAACEMQGTLLERSYGHRSHKAYSNYELGVIVWENGTGTGEEARVQQAKKEGEGARSGRGAV